MSNPIYARIPSDAVDKALDDGAIIFKAQQFLNMNHRVVAVSCGDDGKTLAVPNIFVMPLSFQHPLISDNYDQRVVTISTVNDNWSELIKILQDNCVHELDVNQFIIVNSGAEPKEPVFAPTIPSVRKN